MYTEELIREVKEVYPDSPKMHELAETDSVWLGRYLDDSSYGSVSLDEILTATSLDAVQAKARMIKRKRDLYGKWCDQDPRRK